MEKALLYLIYSPTLKAFKIGITNISNKRYGQHKAKGWVIIRYWYIDNRTTARKIESMVLYILRNKFPKQVVSKADMPQHGYTEVFDGRKTSSKKIIKLIETVIREFYPNK